MIQHTIPDPGPAFGLGRLYRGGGRTGVWSLGDGSFLIGFNVRLAGGLVPVGSRRMWPPGLALDWHFYRADTHRCRPLVLHKGDADGCMNAPHAQHLPRCGRWTTRPARLRETGELLLRFSVGSARNRQSPTGVPSVVLVNPRTRIAFADRDPYTADPQEYDNRNGPRRAELNDASRATYPDPAEPAVAYSPDRRVAIVLKDATVPGAIWPLFCPEQHLSDQDVAVVRLAAAGSTVSASVTRMTLADTPADVVACAVGDDGLTACAVTIVPDAFDGPDSAPANPNPHVILWDL